MGNVLEEDRRVRQDVKKFGKSFYVPSEIRSRISNFPGWTAQEKANAFGLIAPGR